MVDPQGALGPQRVVLLDDIPAARFALLDPLFTEFEIHRQRAAAAF